jgi:hypothetical protein
MGEELAKLIQYCHQRHPMLGAVRARATGASAALARRRLSTAPTRLEGLGELAPATRVLRMARPPVNSMSLELLSSLRDSIAAAEADKECRAIVLASAQPGVFSAGLDITEMHQPDPERLRNFWSTLQEVWLRLSTSRLATVAAIEGHSPAGGCRKTGAVRTRAARRFRSCMRSLALAHAARRALRPFWQCSRSLAIGA